MTEEVKFRSFHVACPFHVTLTVVQLSASSTAEAIFIVPAPWMKIEQVYLTARQSKVDTLEINEVFHVNI